jgi:portal protein
MQVGLAKAMKSLIPYHGANVELKHGSTFSQPNVWDISHPLNSVFGNITSNREMIENNFVGYVDKAFKSNGPVFSVMAARMAVFSEVRFKYRRWENGRPGQLFTKGSLDILEKPWPNGSTGELLAHMIQDADLTGNCYLTVIDGRIVRLRPDWVTILIGTPEEGDRADPNSANAQILLFIYKPPQGEELKLLPEQVAHFSPIPDPTARYRGMSWLTPILRDIEGDNAAILHKKSFFQNAAVPNLAVRFERDYSEDDCRSFVKHFKAEYQGSANAYRTIFLTGGADVTPLTVDFKQLEFNQTVGKGESRIAAAAGVPSSWVGFSEGMQGSALNGNNFSAARRRFADGTIRPLWRMAAKTLESLVKVPEGAELWYDERDIAFIREDAMDHAEIIQKDMISIDQGIKAGFEADACVEAVRDRDTSRLLGHHTGLVSVQMQPPLDKDDHSKDDADKAAVQASAAAALAAHFSLDSITDFLSTGDVEKLKKKPPEEMQPAAPPGGNAGKPGDNPTSPNSGPNAAKPKPAQPGARQQPKPKPTQNGGGNGQQGSK